MAELARQNDLLVIQVRQRLHRTTSNWAWLSAIPHCLNGTELSQEEFRYNLLLRYVLMHQDIPGTCDGCGKKFSIEHALSCPGGGLLMACHDDAAEEWGSLGARFLTPSAIYY